LVQCLKTAITHKGGQKKKRDGKGKGQPGISSAEREPPPNTDVGKPKSTSSTKNHIQKGVAEIGPRHEAAP